MTQFGTDIFCQGQENLGNTNHMKVLIIGRSRFVDSCTCGCLKRELK